MAHVAYLKGACHASFRTIQQLLQETCGLQISTGTLAKICRAWLAVCSRPMTSCVGKFLLKRRCTSTRRAIATTAIGIGPGSFTSFTLFHIDRTRGAVVLDYLLGNQFRGTLQADFYGAYRRYLATHPQADAQFCHAHLVRNVKFLATLPDEADRQFAAKLLAELKELFRLWHARRSS